MSYSYTESWTKKAKKAGKVEDLLGDEDQHNGPPVLCEESTTLSCENKLHVVTETETQYKESSVQESRRYKVASATESLIDQTLVLLIRSGLYYAKIVARNLLIGKNLVFLILFFIKIF